MKVIALTTVVSLLVLNASSQNLRKLNAYSNNTGGYFYTVDWDVLKNGKDDLKEQKSPGIVHFADDKGTSPVYAFYNPWRNGHFYTINEDEIFDGEYGYNLQGVAFYAYKKKAPGTVPLHRYFHQEKRTHFYSTQFAKEINGYGYEGVAFYIFPDEKTAKSSVKKSNAVTFLPPIITKPGYTEKEISPDAELRLIEVTQIDEEDMDSVIEVVDSVVTQEEFRTQIFSPGDPVTFISIDDKRITEFDAYWTTENETKSLVVTVDQKPLLKFIFQSRDGEFPSGPYYTTDGKTAIPDALSVKLIVEPGFVSGIGDVVVVQNNEQKLWFLLLNNPITVTDPKTKQSRILNFTLSMPVK